MLIVGCVSHVEALAWLYTEMTRDGVEVRRVGFPALHESAVADEGEVLFEAEVLEVAHDLRFQLSGTRGEMECFGENSKVRKDAILQAHIPEDLIAVVAVAERREHAVLGLRIQTEVIDAIVVVMFHEKLLVDGDSLGLQRLPEKREVHLVGIEEHAVDVEEENACSYDGMLA